MSAPRPEDRITRAQRDVLLLSFPADSVLRAALVDSDDPAAGGPDLLVCSDVPGAQPARITTSGRVARAAGELPADTFIVDRARLTRCCCSRCVHEDPGVAA